MPANSRWDLIRRLRVKKWDGMASIGFIRLRVWKRCRVFKKVFGILKSIICGEFGY